MINIPFLRKKTSKDTSQRSELIQLTQKEFSLLVESAYFSGKDKGNDEGFADGFNEGYNVGKADGIAEAKQSAINALKQKGIL